MSNTEILNEWLDSGLLKRCIECQFKKLGNLTYMDDFFQDICIMILEYDNDKLNDAHNRHANAWITRVIQNNIFSANSPYYKKYAKYRNMVTELVYEENNDEWLGEYED